MIGAPVPFTVGDREFAVVLGLKEVAAIEKAMATPLHAVVNMLMEGFTSAMVTVGEHAVREKTGVGYQPIATDQLGSLYATKDAAAEFAKALVEAVNALGNGLGLQATPAPTPSPSGSGSGSTRKRS